MSIGKVTGDEREAALSGRVMERADDVEEAIYPSLMAVGVNGGMRYFLPFRPNVQIDYYNAEKFAQYHLQPPRIWPELLAVARTFYEKEQTGRMLCTGAGGAPTTTTFSSIPREVQEAAAVDGCGAWRTLISIILPLALPGLAVCGLLVWLLSWEEFTLATYLTLGAKTMPLQVYYYLYQGNWFDTAVAATLMTLPVLVLSAFLQRYLRETSLAGVMR